MIKLKRKSLCVMLGISLSTPFLVSCTPEEIAETIESASILCESGALPDGFSRICGVVASAKDNLLPIANALVEVEYAKDQKFQAKTNSKGEYALDIPYKTTETAVKISSDEGITSFINKNTQANTISNVSQSDNVIPDYSNKKVNLIKPEKFKLVRLGDNILEEERDKHYQFTAKNYNEFRESVFAESPGSDVIGKYDSIELTFFARGVGGLKSLKDDFAPDGGYDTELLVSPIKNNKVDLNNPVFTKKLEVSPENGGFREYKVSIPSDVFYNDGVTNFSFGIYPATYTDKRLPSDKQRLVEDMEFVIKEFVGILK